MSYGYATWEIGLNGLGNNSRWEERVKGAGRQMEILHEAEEPGALVGAGLLQALPGRGLVERRV